MEENVLQGTLSTRRFISTAGLFGQSLSSAAFLSPWAWYTRTRLGFTAIQQWSSQLKASMLSFQRYAKNRSLDSAHLGHNLSQFNAFPSISRIGVSGLRYKNAFFSKKIFQVIFSQSTTARQIQLMKSTTRSTWHILTHLICSKLWPKRFLHIISRWEFFWVWA